MQKDFKYQNAFVTQLAKFEESGVMSRLRNKWMHTTKLSYEHTCQRLLGPTDGAHHHQVEWDNVQAIFWLLLAGVVGCILTFCVEFCVSRYWYQNTDSK